MALVDYSSSGEDGDGATTHGKPPAKRPKRRRGSSPGDSDAVTQSSMPPLPSGFHDLYAATVRQSTVDDRSLHQGRKRQVPHIPGQWPSHVYIEWRPTNEQHAVLTQVLAGVEEELGRGSNELHSLVTSDLETPLPLHVSLSRPLSLATADKDDFLRRAAASLSSGGVRSFVVRPSRLAWFSSPDSGRSFLVLSVVAAAVAAEDSSDGPLMALLRGSNAVAERFSQPLLYADEDAARTAFHVSIAWTLARPRREVLLEEDREEEEGKPGGLSPWHLPLPDEVLAWRITVDSVKIKIGNVVTSVALSGRAPGQDKTRFLFDEA